MLHSLLTQVLRSAMDAADIVLGCPHVFIYIELQAIVDEVDAAVEAWWAWKGASLLGHKLSALERWWETGMAEFLTRITEAVSRAVERKKWVLDGKKESEGARGESPNVPEESGKTTGY